MKKSVYLSSDTCDWIAATTGENHPEWSSSINATYAEFRHLLRDALPDLTQAEWALLLDAQNGNLSRFRLPIRLSNQLMDNVGALALDDVTAEYGALVRKCHAMNQTEQLAATYFCHLFWSSRWACDWEDVVAAIKAKF